MRQPKPPPFRQRKRAPGQKVDTSRFIQCRIRPHPEWPLVCRFTNHLAFPSKKEAAEWEKKNALKDRDLEWCGKCRMWHYES